MVLENEHAWYNFRNKHPLASTLRQPLRKASWGGFEREWVIPMPHKIVEDWVTWEWREAVCMCDDALYDTKARNYSECMRCGKMARHRLWNCKGCNTKQVLEYTWPEQSIKDVTRCYFCMVKIHGKVDGSAPPKWLAREVKAFSDESLISLDFDDLEL